MKMTDKELDNAVKAYYDSTGKLLKNYNIVAIKDPLTGEMFAVVEDAMLIDVANLARMVALRAQIKAELIVNLQNNASW